MSFSILTVCTGNICRSPLAELYLRRGLSGVPAVAVSSAGTMAVDDDTMPDQARTLARSYGLEPDEHHATFLFESHVREADLIIALAREHRRAVVAMHPRASRYTFTLREAARLAKGITDDELESALTGAGSSVTDRLRATVELLASRRGSVEAPEDPLDDDVVDPFRRSDETFAESGRQLVPAADILIDLLVRASSTGVDN